MGQKLSEEDRSQNDSNVTWSLHKCRSYTHGSKPSFSFKLIK